MVVKMYFYIVAFLSAFRVEATSKVRNEKEYI
jgi:hypothetical protein